MTLDEFKIIMEIYNFNIRYGITTKYKNLIKVKPFGDLKNTSVKYGSTREMREMVSKDMFFNVSGAYQRNLDPNKFEGFGGSYISVICPGGFGNVTSDCSFSFCPSDLILNTPELCLLEDYTSPMLFDIKNLDNSLFNNKMRERRNKY